MLNFAPRSSLGTLGQLLKWPPFSAQNTIVRGKGGSLILFIIGILIFLLVVSPYKISEPYDNPIRDFNNGGESKKRNKIYASADGWQVFFSFKVLSRTGPSFSFD
jgi:hypothetical protein